MHFFQVNKLILTSLVKRNIEMAEAANRLMTENPEKTFFFPIGQNHFLCETAITNILRGEYNYAVDVVEENIIKARVSRPEIDNSSETLAASCPMPERKTKAIYEFLSSGMRANNKVKEEEIQFYQTYLLISWILVGILGMLLCMIVLCVLIRKTKLCQQKS